MGAVLRYSSGRGGEGMIDRRCRRGGGVSCLFEPGERGDMGGGERGERGESEDEEVSWRRVGGNGGRGMRNGRAGIF